MNTLLKILVTLSVLIILWNIVFPKKNTVVDQYECMAQKVVHDCSNQQIIVQDEQFSIDNTEMRYQILSNNEVNVATITTYLSKKEKELVKDRRIIRAVLNEYNVLYCVPTKMSTAVENSSNRLGFIVDHFLWNGMTMDCATTIKKFSLIDSLFSLSILPFSIIGSVSILLLLQKKTKIFIINLFRKQRNDKW